MWRSCLAAAAAAALVAAAAGSADPLDPKIRINSGDQAAAAGVLVTRDDLGAGWAGGRINPVSLKMPRCPTLQPNFSALTLTGHVESNFNNGNGGWQIDTDVTVLKSAKQVTRQFALLAKPQLGTCVRYDVLKTTGSDPNIKLGLVKRLSFPKVGTFARAYRTTIVVKAGKGTVTVYDDTLMLAKGRTSVWMNFIAPSTEVGPLELREQELAKLLLKRIRS
jgi:hypothetical protein